MWTFVPVSSRVSIVVDPSVKQRCPEVSVFLKPLYYGCFCWLDTHIHSVLS